MPKLLLIDDDEKLAQLLGQYLSQFDFQLISALKPSDGFKKLQSETIDLIILDIMLPEMDGFEVLKQLRSNSHIPVIMLTARGDVMDRVVGLELGADDYLPKPFEPRELVARINAVLKRLSEAKSDRDAAEIQLGPLSIDFLAQEAFLKQEKVALSSTEFRLLELFVQKNGETLSRDSILNHLKGIETEIYSRSVDILVSRLRQKLKPYEMIKTVRGMGYRFAAKE